MLTTGAGAGALNETIFVTTLLCNQPSVAPGRATTNSSGHRLLLENVDFGGGLVASVLTFHEYRNIAPNVPRHS